MRIIGIGLFVATLGCNGSKKEPDVKKGEPIETLKIDRSGSYFERIRATSGELRDWQKLFRAEAIDPQKHVAVEKTAKYRIQDRPLFWFVSDFSAVVVDRRYFSDLQAGDATRLGAQQKVTLGKFLDLSLGLSPREVVKFLLESEIIRTYVHIEAEVRLVKETDDGKVYASSWEGAHVYYTNEKNVDEYKFQITIDKKTGEIVLEGR